jgi:murein L,D-transpeptidase YcbB/YkuD
MIFKFQSPVYKMLLLATVLASAGCKSSSYVSTSANLKPGVTILKEDPLVVPIDSSIALFSGLKRKASVIKYYVNYGSNPVWIKDGEFTAFADSMMFVIRNAAYYGFTARSYHLTELDMIGSSSSRDILLRREILLTDAFLAFAGDLKYGLQKSKQRRSIDSLEIALLRSIQSYGHLEKSLGSLEPEFNGYQSLKEGLRVVLDSVKLNGFVSNSLNDRIRLVSINLERWRVERLDSSMRYIVINIPSYMLNVVENDSILFSSRVIVGSPETETPILSSLVECFSIYPYWHVPRKIAVNEYLPMLKKDTSFISRNNFDILDRKGNTLNPDSVDWTKFHQNYFPVVLRQRDGVENSLGVVKFIFDNPYAVFLHDTNARRLFRRKYRAFSHGCIRMEKAVDLAHFLVTRVIGKKSKIVDKYLREKKRYWMELKHPIPIYTRYFTCAYKDGILYTYDDVYSKDKFLYELLYSESFE